MVSNEKSSRQLNGDSNKKCFVRFDFLKCLFIYSCNARENLPESRPVGQS